MSTSTLGAAPEVSVPIRFKGQSNSEVLFNWLTAPAHKADIEGAFILLEKLLKAHFLGSEEKSTC